MATYTYKTTDEQEIAITAVVDADNATRERSNLQLPPRTNAEFVTDSLVAYLTAKVAEVRQAIVDEKAGSLVSMYKQITPEKQAQVDAAIAAILDDGKGE